MHVVKKGGGILAYIDENPLRQVLASRFEKKGNAVLPQKRALILDRILRQHRDSKA